MFPKLESICIQEETINVQSFKTFLGFSLGFERFEVGLANIHHVPLYLHVHCILCNP